MLRLSRRGRKAMNARCLALLAATLITIHVTGDVAAAQTSSPIRDAATRVSFRQTPAPPPQRDSNGNGTAIGALIGAGAMGAMIAIFWARCDAGCENDLPTWGPFAAVGMGAAGGAAVGYLIDRAHRGTRKVVVTPAVTRRERGVKLAVRF
jgi:hypothetical protein